jgi:DNA ligase 1
MKSYLEYKDSKSEKFWEVSVKGKVMTTRWGKLETAGQSKSKELESPALAASEAEKQKASKVKKGYREVAGK